MKKEIPTEVKARIYSLYSGAKVITPIRRETTEGRPMHKLTGKLMCVDIGMKLAPLGILLEDELVEENYVYLDYPDCSLLLTPLSEISDEDKKRISEIEHPGSDFTDIEINGRSWSGKYTDGDIHYSFSEGLSLESYDFLRSRNYALPAFGYSVQDLTDSGVFKII